MVTEFIGTAAPVGYGTKSMGAGKTVDGCSLSPIEDKAKPQGPKLGSGDSRRDGAFLIALCLVGCTTQAPPPPPTPTPIQEPAPIVLTLPPITITGSLPRPAPVRDEPVRERVFCDKWASGVICDSYTY